LHLTFTSDVLGEGEEVAPVIENGLRAARREAGLSQGELAARADTTRQTIGALEAGQYAPTLAVALRLARALGRDVGALFWLDAPPPTVRAELLAARVTDGPTRVQVARVGGRVIARPLDAFGVADGLIARAEVADDAPVPVTLLADPALLDRTAVVLGCDPALTTLGAHLGRRHARAGLRLAVGQASSLRALGALGRGEAHAAGMHLLDEATGEYNLPYIRRAFAGRRVLVVTAAHWQQGLIVAPGNPLGIAGAADLARPDLTIVNREPGAGSRAALDHALRVAGVGTDMVLGYDRVVGTHRTVAEIVAAGLADAGPGILAAASALGLGFVPLAEERYDLVFADETRESAPVAALLDTLASRAFRDEIDALPGYDPSRTGSVVLDETLPPLAG
jgi:molybdate-binding protein/DNA-binding XRE family transcriptional regulator